MVAENIHAGDLPATLHGVVFDIFGWEPEQRQPVARRVLRGPESP
jgi:hypothetical protein